MEEMNSVKQPAKNSTRLFFIGMFSFLGLVLLGVVGLEVYRIYFGRATDAFSVQVADALNLPVMKINGTVISYHEYAADLRAIHVLKEYDQKNGGEAANYSEEIMSDQVLWRLANSVLLKQAADKYGITVEPADLEDLRGRIMDEFKTESAANEELQKRYGWNLAIYEEKVMRPLVLQQKLQAKVEADEQFRSRIKAEAEEVLSRIKGGEDFARLAELYGYDGTAARGGELGWFKRGEMVKEFEDAAFALKAGELNPRLVETGFGYHILKVEDRKMEEIKDEKGNKIKEEQVKARHILFAPTIGKYMDSLAREADIHLYVRVHNPFLELKKKA